MYDMKDVEEVAKKLNIVFDKFTPQDLLEDIHIELEHGSINPKTNVTNNDLLMTAKIALAHLNEFPNYYNKEYGIVMFKKYLSKII